MDREPKHEHHTPKNWKHNWQYKHMILKIELISTIVATMICVIWHIIIQRAELGGVIPITCYD